MNEAQCLPCAHIMPYSMAYLMTYIPVSGEWFPYAYESNKCLRCGQYFKVSFEKVSHE